jgi:hypothetical protein
MARIGRVSTKTVHVIPRALELEVENGIADSVEEAKENNIRRFKKIYGKDVKVYFDGVA